jgi:hypothetical protein
MDATLKHEEKQRALALKRSQQNIMRHGTSQMGRIDKKELEELENEEPQFEILKLER